MSALTVRRGHATPGGRVTSAAHGHGQVHASRPRATISEPVVASSPAPCTAIKLGVVALATFSPGSHGEVREAVERVLARRRARDRVRPARQRRRARRRSAADREHLHRPRRDRHHARARPADADAVRARRRDLASVPMVVLVDARHRLGLGDRHRRAAGSPPRDGRRHAHVRQGRLPGGEPLSNGGALDITVGEYFTPNGRNLGGGGVKQGAGVDPEVKVAHGVDTPHGLAVALETLAAKVK